MRSVLLSFAGVFSALLAPGTSDAAKLQPGKWDRVLAHHAVGKRVVSRLTAVGAGGGHLGDEAAVPVRMALWRNLRANGLLGGCSVAHRKVAALVDYVWALQALELVNVAHGVTLEGL